MAVNSGGKHCLCLSSDSEVFSWGEGEDGKLGHGNRDSYDRPKLIEALSGKFIKKIFIQVFIFFCEFCDFFSLFFHASGLGIVDIACGSAHSAAVRKLRFAINFFLHFQVLFDRSRPKDTF